MTKLSCELPKTEPFAFATPTTSNGRPSSEIVRPIGFAFREKLGLDVVPDERHVHAPRIFHFGDEPAFHRVEIQNDADVRRRAHQRHALGHFLALVHVYRAVRNHPQVFGQRGVRFQKFVFFRLKLRVAPLHFEIFLRVPLHHHDARHPVSVGAHVGDVLRDINVHPGNHRHHGDQRGGGENDPQQRQEAAQLAAAQRLDRPGNGFPK